jgi:disease resistance protein RPM1
LYVTLSSQPTTGKANHHGGSSRRAVGWQARRGFAEGGSKFQRVAALPWGIFSQIREAKDELESIQVYLKGVERFKDTDETTSLFVERIRGFAFEIEDVVDEFTYMLEDKHGGLGARTKKRIKHVKTWHRLACKLQDINGRG